MEYEGQICRPPMEKSSFMLPVAVGCSYLIDAHSAPCLNI